MSSFVYDRVCETSTTTGTGDFTLAGALTGYQTFSGAGVNSTGEFYYLIESVDVDGVANGSWETGIGLLSTATNLQRLVVLSSSNAGAAVTFGAGTKRVHLVAPAYQLSFCGAYAHRTTNLTAQNFTTSTAVAWSGALIDTGVGSAFFENVTNPSRISFPASGYDSCIARLSAGVSLQNITANDWVELKIRQDGSTVVGRSTVVAATTTPGIQVQSSLLLPGSGTYFELMIQVGADTSVDLLASESFFQLEVLQ